MKGRQTVKAGRSRVAWQTHRNIRYGFPQRGRHYWVTSSVQQAIIVLPLSTGHQEGSL